MAPEVVPVAFFSYCREDSEFALKLAADLKMAGAHVWIDQLDIEPGAPWDRAVEDALTHSPHMLVVLSPVSVKSDNVRDEVSFALSRQKRVIPVLYRDCDVPFRLARLQHIDFRVEYERGLSILLRALGVGHAPQSHVGSGVAVAAAAETVVSPIEAEEQTREQKLEERRVAAEQTHLEENGKHAAEATRLQRQREADSQRAVREQEQRAETEAQARQEQSRREQRAAEQARLEEETRLAAERVRLAQEEKERRSAEIKARQEQLRREEQESVERKSVVLEAEPKIAAPRIKLPTVVPDEKVGPVRQATTAGLNLSSPKNLAVAGALLFVLGFIVLLLFVLRGRGGPEKASESKIVESKVAEKSDAQQSPPQTASEKSPADRPSSATPADASQQGQSQGQSKEKVNTAATEKDSGKAKEIARATDALSTSAVNNTQPSAGRAMDGSNAANIATTPNRVHVARSKSEVMLTRKVKPVYPPLARSARVQGQVVLDVVIAKDGSVKEIKAEPGGHPLLIPAAIDAVKQWRYKPYSLNGQRVEFDTQVLVNFTLTN